MSQEKATPQASVDVVSSSVEPHPGHGPLLDNTFQTGVHPTDGKSVAADVRAVPVPTTESSSEETVDLHIDPDRIIITGTDAANHLLSLRDDFDPAITFRGMFLGTILSAFQAVMYQIYLVRTCVRRSPLMSRLIRSPVQTNASHHLWNIHRPHCLLPR